MEKSLRHIARVTPNPINEPKNGIIEIIPENNPHTTLSLTPITVSNMQYIIAKIQHSDN